MVAVLQERLFVMLAEPAVIKPVTVAVPARRIPTAAFVRLAVVI